MIYGSSWSFSIGGERGIRTLGTVAGTTVFKTVPFNHSGTSPQLQYKRYSIRVTSVSLVAT
jgi:hypothetical protein